MPLTNLGRCKKKLLYFQGSLSTHEGSWLRTSLLIATSHDGFVLQYWYFQVQPPRAAQPWEHLKHLHGVAPLGTLRGVVNRWTSGTSVHPSPLLILFLACLPDQRWLIQVVQRSLNPCQQQDVCNISCGKAEVKEKHAFQFALWSSQRQTGHGGK